MITTVTLNASIDKAYHMEQGIQNGTVMRVETCRNSAGGKGLNVVRIVKLCGEEGKATGFVGGFNGAYLEMLLDQDQVPHQFVKIEGETRSCINILDPKYGSTEYLEPGCTVTEQEEEQFLRNFETIIKDSDIVTISGSVPKGVSKEIYQKLIEQAKNMGKAVILDTSGELLKHGLKAKPTMVKPNKDEIEMLFQTKIDKEEDVIDYAKKIHEMGIPYVVISLGKDGAVLVCEEGIYHGKPPKIEAVNTVGCGDSMVGAFAVALSRLSSPEEALRYAVATATAAALSPNTGDFQKEIQETILEQVEINKIS